MDIRAMGLRAGELTHRVTIFAPGGTLNVGDTNVATGVPMKISAMDLSQQKEYMALGGLQASAAYRVLCRYRDDIRMDAILMEECCAERRMQIVNQTPTDRNEGLEMVCVVGTV